MNIYLVERADQAGYDEQRAVVVIAGTENTARWMAASHHGDEGPDSWYVPGTVVTLLDQARDGLDAGVKCRDFHVGQGVTTMTTRRLRREVTTAAQISEGDLITPPSNRYGIARVHTVTQNPGVTEPHTCIGWTWPDDHTVNELHRGQSSGKVCRADESVTRWV